MKHLIIPALTLLLLFAGFSIAPAQEEIETIGKIQDITDAWYMNPEQYPLIDRSINILTPKALRTNSLLIIVDHRTRKELDDEPFHDLLGFDAGGLKIGLGLRYGIMDKTDIGMYRVNGVFEPFDTYEFDARYQFLLQRLHHLDLGARAGFSWFVEQDADDELNGFFQILAGRTFANKYTINTGLLYHSHSWNRNKTEADENHSMAVPLNIEIRPWGGISWLFEVVTAIDGYSSPHSLISTAVKIITNRHTFIIMVTNSQYISASGVVTNAPNEFSDPIVGFTITRELNF